MLAGLGWVLAGCSTLQDMNPINWWHQQQGGEIAKDRPAPPGADQPYPNVGTIPGRPAAPDLDALKKLTASLVADRTNAQHLAQAAPLADPSSKTASPGLFGVGFAPPPPPTVPPPPAGAATPVASVSMPAASAPAEPAAPPSPAPRKAVQSSALPEPAPAQPAAPAPAGPQTPIRAVTPGAMPAAEPALPVQPDSPPPRPAVAGNPPPPPPAPAPLPMPGATSATIVFPAGETALSPAAAAEVKAFAATRGNRTIAIVGYGDAAASAPEAQAVALQIGLKRAGAIAEALKADGVPPASIRINAEAAGRGATLQVLQ
jgi:outer membrane protein OmpA-like peptidoglycan-associated protein